MGEEKQENLHKELDLIQSVISRMTNNSFLVKGWAMTLMSALVAFGNESIMNNDHGIYYLVAMLAILIPFWWLDAYYLQQERIFRKIYERAIMDPNAVKRTRYDLNPRELLQDVDGTRKLMRTGIIKWFYGCFVLLIILGIVLKATGLLEAS